MRGVGVIRIAKPTMLRTVPAASPKAMLLSFERPFVGAPLPLIDQGPRCCTVLVWCEQSCRSRIGTCANGQLGFPRNLGEPCSLLGESMMRGTVNANVRTYGSVGAVGRHRPTGHPVLVHETAGEHSGPLLSRWWRAKKVLGPCRRASERAEVDNTCVVPTINIARIGLTVLSHNHRLPN